MAVVMRDRSQDVSWSIVFVSFMAQLLAYGSPHAVGVLYPKWLSTFKKGKSTTAWVGSTVLGVGLITSPLCSACVHNFGARPVTIFSGVMVAGGLMLSAFASNIIFLIFSYGILVGLGCGLVYAATLTITCQYFDKRRGLALGIITTGSSLAISLILVSICWWQHITDVQVLTVPGSLCVLCPASASWSVTGPLNRRYLSDS